MVKTFCIHFGYKMDVVAFFNFAKDCNRLADESIKKLHASGDQAKILTHRIASK